MLRVKKRNDTRNERANKLRQQPVRCVAISRSRICACNW